MPKHCLILALALIAALLPAPLSAQAQPPDPRFGIVEAYVNGAAATEAGAGYTRVILRWDVIQPAGPDDWQPANVPDPYIAAELAAGRQVVGLLIGTPAWAAADPGAGARAVPDMDRWAAFTRRMAQQYRGRIHHWVIWNEPDVWDLGHPGNTWAGSVEDYYRLLKTAYGAIKGVDPTLTVTLAGLTYFWDQQHGRPQFLNRLLDVAVADPGAAANGYYFDAVVYHLYFNPAQTAAVIAAARAALRQRGIAGKEIWVNETNAPPSDDAQERPWSAPRFHISLAEQSAFVLQEFALAFAAGADRVEFYKLRNSPDHPESIEPFGLLRGDDSRRPAFTAYQVATTYLGAFRAVRQERAGSVYAVTFDRGAQVTTVLWTAAPAATQARVVARAPDALLVDGEGRTRPISPAHGVYTVELPGATCLVDGCAIGGAPRLLVQAAGAGGFPAAILAPSAPPARAATPPPGAAPTPARTRVAAPAPAPGLWLPPIPAPPRGLRCRPI